MKARYGVTFQQGALFTSLTVMQNVQLPMIEHVKLPATMRGRARDAEGAARRACRPRRRRNIRASSRAAWSSARRSRGRSRSIRALLFLDEPTSGLDPISAAAFDELLMELQSQLKLTVVMITHDLDTIFRTCNRVGVIVDRENGNRHARGHRASTRIPGSRPTSTASARSARAGAHGA